MSRIFRNVRRGILCLLLAAAAAAALLLFDSPDPLYRAQELLFWRRFHRFDGLIRELSAQQNLDPRLVKAVIWRESRFRPGETGGAGERGLMQVTEIAAEDWVRLEKIEDFKPQDLYDPRVNVTVGTWYLARGLERWRGKSSAELFALAEYNAGRSRVNRWVDDTNLGHRATADDLRETIDFPGTREYVRTILDRYAYYKATGRM